MEKRVRGKVSQKRSAKVAGSVIPGDERRERANIKRSKPAHPKKAGESRKSPLVAKHTRLLNLSVFILSNRGGVTYDQIAEVDGYNDLKLKRHSEAGRRQKQREDDSLRRRFERDRKELAQIGVVILDRQSQFSARMREFYIDHQSLLSKPIDLEIEELMLLDLVVRSFEGEDDHEIAKLARAGLCKLKSSSDVQLPAPVASTTRRLASSDEESEALDALTLAHSRRCVAEFSYHSVGALRASQRAVEPYGVILRGDAHYVVGRELAASEPKIYRLSRIRSKVNVRPRVGEGFEIPEDFDIEEFFSPQLFKSTGRGSHKTETVMIRFDADVGFIIANAFQGQNTMNLGRDGSVTVAFQTAFPSELFRYLADYSGHFEILKPAHIKRQMQVHLQDTLALYLNQEV